MMLQLIEISFPLTNPILQFSTILFIILFAPIVLNKLKIPYLIGLIIAGAIVGPHGFNLILRDSSIILYGTAGLLYIMFLAGLEVDFSDFKRNSFKGIIFGIFTFSVPMILGYYAGIYLLQMSQISAVLLASMFASHTLIAYPIISKFGITKNDAVSITIGGTIITDTLALMVLAVIIGMTKGEITENFWIELGISFVICAAVIFIGFPIIGRWFFKINNDKVSQYIFVLALVFLGAFLAELAGFEAIIGAFLTGLALNKLIPPTSALMNRIEFVGNALFIPIFLIGVGMLINYKAFIHDIEALKVGFVMTGTATLAKFIAAWFTQKTFRLNKDQRHVIFGLSNAQAAATLAVVLVGHSIILNQQEIDAAALMGNIIEPIRLLSDEVLNGTILMILITCTHASIMAQKGARNIALAEANDAGEEGDSKIEKFLFGISKHANVKELISLFAHIKAQKTEYELYALTVFESEKTDDTEKSGKKILETTEKIASEIDNKIQTHIEYNTKIDIGLIEFANTHEITSLLIGTPQKKEEQSWSKNIKNIIANSAMNIFIYNDCQPIDTIKRNIVFIPKHIENELGFPYLIMKLWNYAKNTQTKQIFIAHKNTLLFLKEIHKKHPIPADFVNLAEHENTLQDKQFIKKDDLITHFMSRESYTAYTNTMSSLPLLLSSNFPDNSFILLYPYQIAPDSTKEQSYKNVSLIESIETLDDIGSTISRVFKIK